LQEEEQGERHFCLQLIPDVMTKSMEKVFHTQSDWFEVKILPAIRRRTIFAVFILAVCVLAWFYYESWVFLVIGALVVAERVFELAHIP